MSLDAGNPEPPVGASPEPGAGRPHAASRVPDIDPWRAFLGEYVSMNGEAAGRQPGRAQRLLAIDLRPSDRFALVVTAALNSTIGLVMLVLLSSSYGADAIERQRMAQALLTGAPFTGALYPPLAAVAFLPLAFLPPLGAAVLLTGLSLTVLVVGWWLETGGLDGINRGLLLAAAVGFGPVVHELLIGQTTLLIAATLYPVVRRDDAARHGLALGVALALAPKPYLLPVMVWMLVWRRRALGAAIMTGTLLTAVGVLALGLDRYRDWLVLLVGIGRSSVAGTYDAALSGNFSLWPLNPVHAAIAAVVLLAALVAILRDRRAGLIAALLAGLLVAPYTELYSIAILLLGVRPMLAVAPRAVRWLAMSANVVLVLVLGFVPWALAALAAVLLPLVRAERPRGVGGGPPA